MIIRNSLTAIVTAVALLSATGCAVTRNQQSAGAFVDDSVITTQIKSRMLADPNVAGTSISVETLNGTVVLSGFAKSSMERSTAEKIARDVNGVRQVKNDVVVRP